MNDIDEVIINELLTINTVFFFGHISVMVTVRERWKLPLGEGEIKVTNNNLPSLLFFLRVGVTIIKTNPQNGVKSCCGLQLGCSSYSLQERISFL